MIGCAHKIDDIGNICGLGLTKVRFFSDSIKPSLKNRTKPALL